MSWFGPGKIFAALVRITVVIALGLVLSSVHAPVLADQTAPQASVVHSHDTDGGDMDRGHPNLHEDHIHGFNVANAHRTPVVR